MKENSNKQGDQVGVQESTPPVGQKYYVNIEGNIYEWERDTISVSEIRSLGKLPVDLPVIEVDLKTNTERTLTENEIVEIKPGKAFAKKVEFRRGF